MVARLFEQIFCRYPDVHLLAQADLSDLETLLAPLGLKKRAPFLLKAAQYIVDRFSGYIPDGIDDLLLVPGLGPYTASAIVAFAFNSSEVPADVNVLRLLSRLTGLPMKHPTKGSTELRMLFPLLSAARGGPRPEKLLDFSRLICRPRNPNCNECPLRDSCVWYNTKEKAVFLHA